MTNEASLSPNLAALGDVWRRSFPVVLALMLAAWSSPALAQPAPASVSFKIFLRGSQVGTEQVEVRRSADGFVVSGSNRLAPPIDVITNRCEVRYDAQGRPLDATVDTIIRGQYASSHTVFGDGTATSTVAQSGRQPVTRTDKIGADDVVLTNGFFGLYEGLSDRLRSLAPGADLKAYVLPQAEVAIRVNAAADERIQTPERTIAAKHYRLSFASPTGPVEMDLWADDGGRLLRLAIPSQGLEMVREDVASVASRTEVAPRAGDEQVRIPANGFMLAGTLSRPGGASPGTRYPAVVLVGGSGPTDRDEFVAGIPIFAQVAGALADAGFIVLRYDKRGVGQSGGRAETAGLEQYAEDAIAALRFLRGRKDVDRKRLAMAGHSEGGWTAMLAARSTKDISALVLIATPGVTGADLILAQQEHLLQAMNLKPEERQAKVDLQKKIQKAVTTGGGWQDVPADLRKQADTPWFRSFLTFDPVKVMAKVRQPVLIVQGDLDKQIFAPQADRLAQMARARKGRAGQEVTLVHAPGVNHLLVPATTGEVDEYQKLPDKNVSKSVLTPIVDWLKKALRSSE